MWKKLAVHVGLLFCLSALVTGCGDDPEGNQNQNDHNHNDHNYNGHEAAGAIEIETRGEAGALLARWTPDGWEDADGDSITELPTPVDVEGEGLQPFTAFGARASLTVRFIDPDGNEIEMSTVSRDEDSRERECSVFSARYYPTDDNTSVLAWPNVAHPDGPNGTAQFVELSDGSFAGIYHCDHIHIYPKEEGTVDVEFVLWHIDHSDDVSDPLTIRVEAGE